MEELESMHGKSGNGADSLKECDVSDLALCGLEFWGDPEALERFDIHIQPPVKPLAILEKLGPSPFERGSFPLIGFLATTFDKVSQYALERAGYQPHDPVDASPSDSTPS